MSWTLTEAVEFCRLIAPLAVLHNCHVALTGGTLYKDGPRKDVDILFYRHRQADRIEVDQLLIDLRMLGIEFDKYFSWGVKALLDGRKIDFFFPEVDMRQVGYQPGQDY
jgi:hypothetical protein